MTVRVGSVFHGYCGDAFELSRYSPKRVEAVGADWVVVRNDDGLLGFASLPNDPEGFEHMLAEWSDEREPQY